MSYLETKGIIQYVTPKAITGGKYDFGLCPSAVNQPSVKAFLPGFLSSCAIFLFSIHSVSANCERSFSRMGWMISSRRAGITADNADKRLTISNQIPQKRRLLDLCDQRKIKRARLETDLFQG